MFYKLTNKMTAYVAPLVMELKSPGPRMLAGTITMLWIYANYPVMVMLSYVEAVEERAISTGRRELASLATGFIELACLPNLLGLVVLRAIFGLPREVARG